MKNFYTYCIGFGFSILLTLMAFGLVGEHLKTDHTYPSHQMAVPLLVMFAIGQLCVQLIFFLHLGQEQKPRWNLQALLFALLVTAILVGGTLWIMHNLSHGQMKSEPNILIEENIFPQTP